MKTDETVLILIDVQGKLARLMHDKEELFDTLQRLIRGMQALRVPILWLEQIPEKMGPTLPELAGLLTDQEPIAKSCFSCAGEANLMTSLTEWGRRHVVLAGIETHVCVYQTARDLVEKGYEVDVVADAVSSRTRQNRAIGLERCKLEGANITSLEMILFELMETAEHPAFKDILRIVK
jgi:nicotinamidase-related amidase